MDVSEIVLLIVIAIVTAAALCWLAVWVAVGRVRNTRNRPGGRAGPRGV